LVTSTSGRRPRPHDTRANSGRFAVGSDPCLSLRSDTGHTFDEPTRISRSGIRVSFSVLQQTIKSFTCQRSVAPAAEATRRSGFPFGPGCSRHRDSRRVKRHPIRADVQAPESIASDPWEGAASAATRWGRFRARPGSLLRPAPLSTRSPAGAKVFSRIPRPAPPGSTVNPAGSMGYSKLRDRARILKSVWNDGSTEPGRGLNTGRAVGSRSASR